MNFSDPVYLALGTMLGLSMAALALLNSLPRQQGGLIRGWTGAIFIGLCWSAGIAFIIVKTMS